MKCKCPVTKAIPGWREDVEPQRQDSLFWHNIWLSAGKPNKGVMFEIMKRTRDIYHYAVRYKLC